MTKTALYFSSQYGIQTLEFEGFLNENNVSFKRRGGNIFIHNSETVNYELVVTGRIKRLVFDFLKENRFSHIQKTGEHFIEVL